MKNLDQPAKQLFSKIRGRFPGVTIGDSEGNVTTDSTQARFFEFPFKEGQEELGKVSVSLSEEDGVVIMYSQDIAENDVYKKSWYDFLKELRQFAKKRMLNFDTRDITKSNLEKRDYQYLANRPEDSNMNESKLYGTSRISYQNVGEARIMIKHTESINQEAATGRTQKIGKIYIESADGERFRYPFKHLSGARAMARHVSEGGNAYDEFGKHIVGLSEEMSKLRKFKNYMGRSAVMAESLVEYMDVVKGRITTVKKTIESLQKPKFYAETFAAFETPIMEEVPTDVAENWIDQLTIKQFNEELSDVFPYIYKLVSEASKATELGPDDLDESGLQYHTGVKKHGKEYMDKAAAAGRKGASQEELGRLKDKYSKAAKTKEEIELEAAFEATLGQFSDAVCEECGNQSWETLEMTEEEIEEGERHGNSKIYNKCWKGYRKVPGKNAGEKGSCKKVESEEDTEEGNAYAHAVKKAKMNGKKKGDKIDGPDGDEITLEKDEKTPLGEFILSYFDRESGKFPKGETAVLTMVEKDYGEKFITPAKQFIEMINSKVSEVMAQQSMQQPVIDEEPHGTVMEPTVDQDEQFGEGSGLQYHTGVKKHGKEYMDKAAQAGREGASQEELGRLKDRYSKAEKNKATKEAQDIMRLAGL